MYVACLHHHQSSLSILNYMFNYTLSSFMNVYFFCLLFGRDMLSLPISMQEAKLSQETLADQVVKTIEEMYDMAEKLKATNKVT